MSHFIYTLVDHIPLRRRNLMMRSCIFEAILFVYKDINPMLSWMWIIKQLEIVSPLMVPFFSTRIPTQNTSLWLFSRVHTCYEIMLSGFFSICFFLTSPELIFFHPTLLLFSKLPRQRLSTQIIHVLEQLCILLCFGVETYLTALMQIPELKGSG